jgi:hypothetical protein
MDEKVVRLGERLPLSTRRVVSFCGEVASFQTALGLVEGLGDGAILVRNFEDGTHHELTPAEARHVARAFMHAASAVEQWQEHASGFNKIRVTRSPDGVVSVTWRGRTRPMRLSKLRGSRHFGGHFHTCGECKQRPTAIYVAADDVREHDVRVAHVEVCQDCVDRLANLPETVAVVVAVPQGTRTAEDG